MRKSKKPTQQTNQFIRDRALFYEGFREVEAMLRQQAAWRTFRPTPIYILTPEQVPLHLSLAGARAKDHEPRCGSGSSKAQIKRLRQMRKWQGRLDFLRLGLPGFIAADLQTDAGRRVVMAAAKKVLETYLAVYGRKVTTYIAVVEHGPEHGMHIHIVVPHLQLSASIQAAVLAAPEGKGGGLTLTDGTHAVLVRDTDTDLRRLGAYLSKFPDARSKWHPDHPRYRGKPELYATHLAQHLELKNELAERWLSGQPAPTVRLSWFTTCRKPTKTRGPNKVKPRPARRLCTLSSRTSPPFPAPTAGISAI